MTPKNATMSDKRSRVESRNEPYFVTRPDSRATLPSSMSKRLATIRTMPAHQNSPIANNTPQPMLMTTPVVVRIFGAMPSDARPRVIASMIRVATRPISAPSIQYSAISCQLSARTFAISDDNIRFISRTFSSRDAWISLASKLTSRDNSK